MFKKNIYGLIITIILLSVLSITTGVIAQDYPITITDNLGEKIIMEEKPQKIISISPNITEVLFAVGAGENVIGVTTFADYPKEATKLEKIGTITEPNIEKIITMNPDLVVASSANKMETIDRLKELNIKVAGFSSDSINMAIENIKKIGILTGNEEKADKIVAKMYIQIAEIKDLVDKKLKNQDRPKVFYELWSDPLYTAGIDNFIDDLIYTAGGFNIGRLAETQWPQFSLEKLLVEDPEVYISTPHSAQMKVSVESIKKRERFQSITAIKNDRIYVIDEDILNRPSPRLVTGLSLLTKAIWPDLTEEVNSIIE
jgi:iron complex transport system substrate-binding protein